MAALRRLWRQPLGRGAYLAHQQAPLLVAIGLAALFQLQPLSASATTFVISAGRRSLPRVCPVS